jgi:hypothetical protein
VVCEVGVVWAGEVGKVVVQWSICQDSQYSTVPVGRGIHYNWAHKCRRGSCTH